MHLGLSPEPEGMFLNFWAFLRQLEGHGYNRREKEAQESRGKTQASYF